VRREYWPELFCADRGFALAAVINGVWIDLSISRSLDLSAVCIGWLRGTFFASLYFSA